MIYRMLARGFIPPNPLPIPSNGLKLWLDSDVGVTLSGSDVTAWADQSGNSNDVVQNGAAPQFEASTINGLPGISFIGSVGLINTTKNVVPPGNARTVFAVCRPTSGGAETFNIGGSIISFSITHAEVWWEGLGSLGPDTYGYSTGLAADTLVAAPTIADLPFLVEVSGTLGGYPTFVLNGTTYPLTASTVITTETGDPGFVIGNIDWAPTQYFQGVICEIVVYDRVLAGADLDAVRTYLNTKYGLGAPQPPAGMRAWYDAALGVTTSGSNVTTWADQSGNGFDLTPYGGDDVPTLHTNVVNGLPGLLFDTVNGNAQLVNSSTVVAVDSPRYVVAVVKPTVPTVGPQPAGFSWGGSLAIINSSVGLFYPVLGDYTGYLYVTGNYNFTPDPTTADTAYAYEWGSTGFPGDLSLFLDGTAIGPGGYTSSSDGAANLIVGSDNANGNGSFCGYICELLIYDHVLTGDDLTQLRTYVNTKYAL